ncbi:MAG: hypothetical protein AAB215_02570 [Planctomycetota bacterium]
MIPHHPVSPAARVFIVVNLIISVALCAFAWSFAPYQRDFRPDLMVSKAARQIDIAARERKMREQEQRIQALQQALRSEENQLSTKTQDVATLDTEIKSNMDTREVERKRFEEQKVELTRVRRDIEKEAEDYEVLVGKREELQDELRRAKLDKVAADDAVIAWAANKEIEERDLRDIETSLNRARRAVRDRDVILALIVDRVAGVKDLFLRGGLRMTGPALYAKVLQSKPDQNVYILSIGSDDGAKAGYTFIAYRLDPKRPGNYYLADLIVDKVFPDYCSARIVEKFQKGEVLPGDDVATWPGSGVVKDEGLP